MPDLDVQIANEQAALAIDCHSITNVIRTIARSEGIAEGAVSVAFVDDAAIHLLNRKYLEHDYPTDVLSFVLEREQRILEGEIIVSTETAIAQANEYKLEAWEELVLYVVHGMLHLVGYDDKEESDRSVMRQKESDYMSQLGFGDPNSAAESKSGANPNSGAKPNTSAEGGGSC